MSPRCLDRFSRHRFHDQSVVSGAAAQHPGALTAYFLGVVRQKTNQGLIENTHDLRRANVLAWAERYAGWTEVRNVKEAVMLAVAMDLLNRGQFGEMAEVLAQTARIELTIPLESGAVPSGLVRPTT